jgi:DNA-binding transcriptional regulator YhcF (GntR family)
MRFSNDKPIFMQIADMLEDEIVAGRLGKGDRLPSARDLASSLEVNPNTASRALQAMADQGVAVAERGTGYFVAAEAADLARLARRERFFGEALPGVFKTMDELGIGMEELAERYAARAGRPAKERL